jgi:ADP-heptose:LPS heptosyltransferase
MLHRVLGIHGATEGLPVKAGLCWAGGNLHRNDRNRSSQITDWVPLLKVPGVTWISLQWGPRAGEALAYPFADTIADTTDLLQTSDVIRTLDLVVTVDTVILHMAGAIGVETWAAVASSPDFRWGLKVGLTPWYPSVRLFRQEKAGEWGPVVEAMASYLRERLGT